MGKQKYLQNFSWKFTEFDENDKLIDKISTYSKSKKHEENYNKHINQIAQKLVKLLW